MADLLLIDRRLIARGAERSSTMRFMFWLVPWVALVALGIYAAALCLYYGLNQTHMDNRFAFGMWIYLDLGMIAMGAGAFFTGFLVYILKQEDLKPILNSAVVVGLICYSGAVAVLMVDVGQPLRAWFTFWHPNTHSMLTEVTFCITCYLFVLILEYLPVLLRNRQLRKVPSFLVFEHQLHKLVPVLAGVGAFLSFFHQGSLGGLYGVLRGRPFAFRQGFAIWPSTFFLFILSAIAVGPSFLMLVTATAETLTERRLVQPSVFRKLGLISGVLLGIYVAAKAIDTLVWLNITSPGGGLFSVGLLRLQAFWFGPAVSGDRAFGVAPRVSSHLARDHQKTRLVAVRRGPGLRRSAAEPLHSHRANPRLADAGVRRFSAIHPKLAGGGDLRRRDRLWRDSLFFVLSLLAVIWASEGSG